MRSRPIRIRAYFSALIEEGVGFEIASISELDLLLGLGVPAAEIYYSNPMKSRAYLEYAASKGVEWYVLDSVEELRKIVSVKPDAKMYLRIRHTEHWQRLAAGRKIRDACRRDQRHRQ